MSQAVSHIPSSRRFVVDPSTALSGQMSVPGDKSMSHRSIMFGAIASGVTEVAGFLEGEDSLHTLEAFRSLGVRIERGGEGCVTLYGEGVRALKSPSTSIYLGNSGTGMRLLTGLIAGIGLPCTLTGDSISQWSAHAAHNRSAGADGGQHNLFGCGYASLAACSGSCAKGY